MYSDLEYVKSIHTHLEQGSLEDLTLVNIERIHKIIVDFLCNNKYDLEVIREILEISNIVYNNTNRSLLFLEDGIYDIVVNFYNVLTGGKAPVGAKPIHFNEEQPNAQYFVGDPADTTEGIQVFREVNRNIVDMFDKFVNPDKQIYPSDYDVLVAPVNNQTVKKNELNVKHEFPELAGTIEKCQFITETEAMTKTQQATGLIPDLSKVEIFEPYFFRNWTNGITTPVVASLKMDGVSVQAVVKGDTIVQAMSRGDTANDEAQDLTHIFYGYKFERAFNVDPNFTFGIQFECIITDYKLEQLKMYEGITYNNKRTAVIGLLSRNDASRFVNYFTLVPIRASEELFEDITNDRVVEIEFLNQFYSSGVPLSYIYIDTGDYASALYQIQEFVREAEYLRSFLPFMYDGVVIEYTDPAAKKTLGRVNSVNKWQKAIKFQAQQKMAKITNIEFTVGHTGRVTPMAYFTPVEFFGGIHNKTTLHSYKRFKELNLRLGDDVCLEYRNDVILYLTKPPTPDNECNPNPPFQFPEVCPYCGTKLMFTENMVFCPNYDCPERTYRRVDAMLSKLNFKDFSYELVKKLDIRGFKELMLYDLNKAESIIGHVMAMKMLERIDSLTHDEIMDYRLFDALGFENIGADKWQKILQHVTIPDLLQWDDELLATKLGTIPGIGPSTIKTILEYRFKYKDDIQMIMNIPNLISSFGDVRKLISVRFTGCRDEELCKELNATGKFDASGSKSVNRQTDILVVPYDGFQSVKLQKIGSGTRVITLDEIRKELLM